MGEFDSVWTTYWQKANPFFTEPLEIESGPISVENLVGRQTEKDRIKGIIRMGGGIRFLIIGEAGVGKTSLVNYVRNQARKENFVSPLKEISIPRNANVKQVMVETLVLLFDEIKAKNVKIDDEVRKRLEYLQPFADLEDYEGEGNIWESSTNARLVKLFKDLGEELKNVGFKSIILHYNNLDKIRDEEILLDFFQDFRDFMQNPNTIFIFIGDNLLHNVISNTPRLNQIFQMPALEVGKLTEKEVKEVINIRIDLLRIDNTRKYDLIEEEAIEMLYKLFDGNIRHILNSISFCFQNLSNRNLPRVVTKLEVKDILFKAVQEIYLKKLSDTEKEILRIIMLFGKITPTELAKQAKKSPQNISAYYLKNLLESKAVELIEKRGREKFYAIVPQIKWWKLEKTKEEIKQEVSHKEKELSKVQSRLDYFR